MALTFFASESHFVDHLLPTYLALPSELAGPFVVPPALAGRLDAAGIRPGPYRTPDGPTVVASYGDLRRTGRRARVALSEHGAGQTYRRRHPSYAGGPGRDRVGLFLCQSHRVAATNERYWPGRRYVVVGVPRLAGAHRTRTVRDGTTVAVGFHWDCTVVPETRWAWPHYRDSIVETIRDAGYDLVGHGHPRVADHLAKWWTSKGVPFVASFDEVLDRADVYVVDNSSTLYEAASVGIPVVALNAPWYRRDVSHGLRFWDQIPGPDVDGPDELPAALAATRTRSWAEDRERTLDRVFAYRDGSAAARAAAGIVAWADDGYPIVTDPEKTTMADRSHDPFAPRRKSGGTTRARAGAPVPARRSEAVETDPAPTSLPTDADEVVAYLDAAGTDDDRAARAAEALDAEADRAPTRRRVSVLAALGEILGPDTVDARLDTTDENAVSASDDPTPADPSDNPAPAEEHPAELDEATSEPVVAPDGSTVVDSDALPGED